MVKSFKQVNDARRSAYRPSLVLFVGCNGGLTDELIGLMRSLRELNEALGGRGVYFADPVRMSSNAFGFILWPRDPDDPVNERYEREARVLVQMRGKEKWLKCPVQRPRSR